MSHSQKVMNIESLAHTIAQKTFWLSTHHSDKNDKMWKKTAEQIDKLYGKLGLEIQSLNYEDIK